MALSAGTRIGAYEVKAPLGEGGMGIVFRALDTTLQRDVALKLLPDHFANDADRLSRFQREAQVLASLNHPNIAHIYGLEESGSARCIVMELVEGETLQERLKRGAIPVDEVLAIAKQIAEALEAAHERGVIHRDLKPANIKLTPDGKVKVLDFGLAKVFDQHPAPTLSNSPTLMSASVPGVILGTAAYMSPEQAKGKEVDRASDLWAFGCVLYEMLTGRVAFEGETVGEVLAGVFKGEPDWTKLPHDTPESVRRVLRRCLQKQSQLRLRDIRDARLEFDEATNTIAAATPTTAPSARYGTWLYAGSIAILLLIASALAWVHFTEPVPDSSVTSFVVLPPTGASFHTNTTFQAISPDGRRLVYGGVGEDGRQMLWIRRLESVEAQVLPGTDGATFPFWSPDSRFVGFFSQGKLKKIDASGGPAQILCDANGGGGSWNSPGDIVFASSYNGPIFRVSASGGVPVAVTELNKPQNELGHAWPWFLPDGRQFLYLASNAQREKWSIRAASLDSKESKHILDSDSAPAYANGYLFFVRQDTLMAQPFDSAALTLSGEPVPVAERVSRSFGNGGSSFSVSANGVLTNRTVTSARTQLVWHDRQGKQLGTVGLPGVYAGPAISPDGSKIAVERSEAPGIPSDVWIFDARGVPSRFTFHTATDGDPVWSPDGKTILFHSNREGQFDLYQKDAAGAGREELLLKSNENKVPVSLAPNGLHVIFASLGQKSNDLWLLPLSGDRKPFLFLQTEFNEGRGQFSPDGRWVAYSSNESGRDEVYIQPFAPSGGKWQVSNGGGLVPKWRGDGKELFYVTPDGKLMAVSIKTSPSVETGLPGLLFEARFMTPGRNNYDVTADGQRFLVNTRTEESAATPITVTLNWPSLLKR